MTGAGLPAKRVVVVSLQKAGTHLIEGVLRGLGYQSVGAAVRVPTKRTVQFDRETRLGVAEQVVSRARYRAICAMPMGDEFARATDDAWSLLSWAWQRRWGFPIRSRYGEAVDAEVAAFVARSAASLRFCDTPPGLAWYLHELDLDMLDASFFRDWSAGDVRVIFNFRDIRDIFVSFVNYLQREDIKQIGNFANYRVYRDILRALPSMDARLTQALIDPSFPGHDAHARALWLLQHPDACKVSFEELIGRRGGGNDRLQKEALQRIAGHLSIQLGDSDVERLANLSYDPGSFTFFRGMIGAWQEAFAPSHLDLYKARYSEVARLYGYQ